MPSVTPKLEKDMRSMKPGPYGGSSVPLVAGLTVAATSTIFILLVWVVLHVVV